MKRIFLAYIKNTFLIVAGSFALFLSIVDEIDYMTQELTWDEVDYVNVAKEGILKNAFEVKSLSFKDFIQLSYLKYQNKREDIIKFSNNVISESEDYFLLRHFHPTLPIYYWSLFASADNLESTFFARVSSLVFYGLFIFLFLYTLFRDSGNKLNLFQKVGCLVFFTSPIFVYSNLFLNFHIFLSLFAVLMCSFGVRFLKNNSRRNTTFFSIFSALTLLSLETGIIFLACFVIIMFFNIGHLKRYKVIFNYLLLTILIFILLWPGILYSGAPLKTFFMHAYRIFLDFNTEYSGISSLENLVTILANNILLSLFILVSLFNVLKKIRSYKFINFVPIILGFTYLTLISFVSFDFTYFLPGISLMMFGLLYLNRKHEY